MKFESLHVEKLTIKVRSNLKIKNKYIERNYSQSSDSIHAILGLLDRLNFLFQTNIYSCSLHVQVANVILINFFISILLDFMLII